MIRATHVSKNFGGIQALLDVSFTCNDGAVLGLVGPNGSGKSTLVNVLTNMVPRDSGSARIDGGFSRTFQDVRLWEHMTVLENVLLVTQSHHSFASLFEFRPDEGRARAILDRVGLALYGDVHAKHLSYGQRKLLEIGRALAAGVSALFLDEPFAGLFPEMVERVKEIVREERALGTSIVLIEHDMSVIRELCDAVIVLDAGSVIAEGVAEEVLANERVIEAYLGK